MTTPSAGSSETQELRARVTELEDMLEQIRASRSAGSGRGASSACDVESEMDGVSRRTLLRSLAAGGAGAALGTAAVALAATPAAAFGWSTYTPQIWTDVPNSNPVLGAGSVQAGHYYQSGGFVAVKTRIAFGTSGVDPGDGQYRMTLPVRAAPGSDALFGPTGVATLHEQSSDIVRTAAMVAIGDVFNVSLVAFRLDNTTAPGVTDASPWTWSNQDTITAFAFYEAL